MVALQCNFYHETSEKTMNLLEREDVGVKEVLLEIEMAPKKENAEDGFSVQPPRQMITAAELVIIF